MFILYRWFDRKTSNDGEWGGEIGIPLCAARLSNTVFVVVVAVVVRTIYSIYDSRDMFCTISHYYVLIFKNAILHSRSRDLLHYLRLNTSAVGAAMR